MALIVEHLQDSTYQVRELISSEINEDLEGQDVYNTVHQGSLTDCEAYIRLTESGHLQ